MDRTDNTGSIVEKICSTGCEIDADNKNIYYGENKICINDCKILANTPITDYDKKCVASCSDPTYRFQLKMECVDECEDDDPTAPITDPPKLKRYSEENYVCKAKCSENENIVIEGRKCVSQCNGYLDIVQV